MEELLKVDKDLSLRVLPFIEHQRKDVLSLTTMLPSSLCIRMVGEIEELLPEKDVKVLLGKLNFKNTLSRLVYNSCSIDLSSVTIDKQKYVIKGFDKTWICRLVGGKRLSNVDIFEKIGFTDENQMLIILSLGGTLCMYEKISNISLKPNQCSIVFGKIPKLNMVSSDRFLLISRVVYIPSDSDSNNENDNNNSD